MESLLLFAGVAVMAAFLAYQIWSQNTEKSGGDLGQMPAMARKNPLSEIQQNLFRSIREAVPEHIVLTQVCASTLVAVDATAGNSKRWLGMLEDEILDVVVCRDDFSIVAAIKLEDPSDFIPEHQQADESLGNVLTSLGIKLVRLPSNNLPPVNALRHTLR